MTQSPADPPPPPATRPRALPRNIVPLMAACTLGLAGLTVLALWFAGLVGTDSFIDLGISAALLTVASLLWLVVDRQRHLPREEINLLAWIAFPFSILLLLGQTPFLVRAIYPPISDFLEKEGQVEARYVNHSTGLKLRISFPRPLAEGRGDLRINSTPLGPEHFEEEAGLITWPERSALSISVPEILKQLGYQRIETVSLNLGVQLAGDTGKEAGSPGRLRYADGERVQPQTLRPPSP
ncbi:MAG: hypothetical protein VX254_06170 [Planctomycetota bacterium]|nr:hypothetical protein [Planctomycetota bacterium]